MNQSTHNQVFALLVGIDNYPDGVPQLKGCVNDINAIELLLNQKYQHFNINIKKLLNQDATRQNLINSFRSHLCKAKSGDTVLFYYSGHGSRENTPKEFWADSPDKKNETLVCYDSRKESGFDLADKELAVLISEVALNNPHIIICLDCCYSGSGTRDTIDLGIARQVEKTGNNRLIGEYLDGFYEKQFLKDGSVAVPQSSHVLLSACQYNEKAYETTEKHGLFTTSLLSCLSNQTQGGNTYAELFQSLSVNIRTIQKTQHPNFEYFGGFNPHSLFLSGQPSDRVKSFPIYYDIEKRQWKAGKGAIHGVPIENTSPISVWIFENNTSSFIYENQIAEAEFTTVEMEESVVILSKELNKALKYTAFQVGSGIKNAVVFSELPSSELVALNEYQETSNKATADYWVLKNDETIQVVHNLSQKIISENTVVESINTALQKIARWENFKKLSNPKSKLSIEAVKLELQLLNEPENIIFNGTEAEICLQQLENNEIETKHYRIVCSNNSGKDLYFKLLFISPLYGIMQLSSEMIGQGMGKILIDESLGFFPEQYQDSESNGVFKVIASTQEIDLSFYEQENFSHNEDFRQRPVEDQNIENTRFLRKSGVIASQSSDWFTKEIKLRLVKINSSIGNKEVKLADGQIKIQPHVNLKAKVSLTELFNASRGTDNKEGIIQSVMSVHNMSLLTFGSATKSISSYQLIELQEIEGDVSQNDPLIITVEDLSVQANEVLLPVTIDGDNVLVIGGSQRMENGMNEVSIERLPETESNDGSTRNIGRAIKFCLMKLVFKSNPANYFQLRWVDYSAEIPIRKTEDISAKIQEANHILLFVHGIIGDTEGMLPFAKKIVKSNKDDTQKPFDLALTFDYECLNTPINLIAENLKIELAKVGIKDTAYKKITIVSHSMGGLVSRVLIEKLGGAKIVEKLIMAGTPNGGSVFGKIPNYLSLVSDLLTIGLTTPIVAPYLAWAAGLAVTLKKSDKLTITLGEMETGSDFIRELSATNDPKTPYYILAGRVDEYSTNGVSWKDTLLKKLVVGAGNLFHKGELHDIAVYTSSIERIDSDRKPKPINQEVACPHVFYFDEPASTAILCEWLGA